jgi:iron-sulfur cluster assembly protein
MLQLSEAAVAAIREFADDGALRFVTVADGDELEFETDVVAEPEEGDQVVESGGARVFLDSRAAQELADQVLDVHAHGDHVHFVFSPQNDEG